MVSRKDKVKAEMDEVLGYLTLYKEAFPENPAFSTPTAKKGGKAGAAAATEEKPAQVVAAQEPAVDITKVVEDALNLVADTVIFGTLNQDQGVALAGSNQNITDAISHVVSAFTGLTEGLGTWSSAKGSFVDTFSRLINKSATQVGTNTSRSYSDLHTYITAFSDSEGQTLLQIERVAVSSPAAEKEAEQYQEEEKTGAEGESPSEPKEGETGLLSEQI